MPKPTFGSMIFAQCWIRNAVAGFARARCGDCGHDYIVVFSCKGRGVCPACNTRRMVETAALLADHVFPRLAVRQWVLSVPKRLRYFMQRDGAVLGMCISTSAWLTGCLRKCRAMLLMLLMPMFKPCRRA